MDESIDAQIRAIEEYADKNDIKIVNKFIDRAKSSKRNKSSKCVRKFGQFT